MGLIHISTSPSDNASSHTFWTDFNFVEVSTESEHSSPNVYPLFRVYTKVLHPCIATNSIFWIDGPASFYLVRTQQKNLIHSGSKPWIWKQFPYIRFYDCACGDARVIHCVPERKMRIKISIMFTHVNTGGYRRKSGERARPTYSCNVCLCGLVFVCMSMGVCVCACTCMCVCQNAGEVQEGWAHGLLGWKSRIIHQFSSHSSNERTMENIKIHT